MDIFKKYSNLALFKAILDLPSFILYIVIRPVLSQNDELVTFWQPNLTSTNPQPTGESMTSIEQGYLDMARHLTAKLKNPSTIGFTGIVAGGSTGKSTQLEGLEKAAILHPEIIFADSSGIMKWHRDPVNNSLFMKEFITAKEEADKGKLVGNELTFVGLIYYLVKMQYLTQWDLNRHLLLSGFPRTGVQESLIAGVFPNIRLAYISCEETEAEKMRAERVKNGSNRNDDKPEIFKGRWVSFGNETLPFILKFKQRHPPERFREIPFAMKPLDKALALLGLMDITAEQRATMHEELTTVGTDAWNHFDAVGKPKPKAVQADIPMQSEPSARTQVLASGIQLITSSTAI